MTTDDGQRLHVRGTDGYVDVATATGDERLSDLTAVLSGGDDVMASTWAAPSCAPRR